MPSYFFHIVFDLDTASLEDRLSRLQTKCHNSSTGSTKSNSTKTETVRRESSNGDQCQTTASVNPVSHDWRYDRISKQDLEMQSGSTAQVEGTPSVSASHATAHITNIGAGPGGLATKGRYEPLGPQEEELGWGVVRLYKDSEETPGLYDKPETPKTSKHGRHNVKKGQDTTAPFRDEDCTTLCILAVPSYLTPSDFLGFVGEKTREDVSHFRMIRTERGNRYMVLMKFRNGKRAREWRREWNGKPFDGMEVSF